MGMKMEGIKTAMEKNNGELKTENAQKVTTGEGFLVMLRYKQFHGILRDHQYQPSTLKK